VITIHQRYRQTDRRTDRQTTCDRNTDPLMFGSRVEFSGQRIERRCLRFEQIQDGGHRHVGIISSGDIYATGRPIHFIFCPRVGFSGTADIMALFPVRTNLRWRPLPSWKNFKWPYLRNGSRSTHCAAIFAIAQLSCSYSFQIF